jgi:phosphoenolpyruvate-protein kinase (PTS system EI component)
MFRLQDRTTLIPDVRNRTLTLIEREDDTRSCDNFLIYLSHNVTPSKGLEIHTYRLLAS